MSIVRWNPVISRALSQWPDFWEDDILPSVSSLSSSNLDVYETDNEVIVRANVAGVTEKDIDLTFEKGVLFIKADRQEVEEDKKKKHYSRSSWNYSYKVAVPGLIDYNLEPQVELEDGMLIVTFKKAEASKPKKLAVKRKNNRDSKEN